MTTLAAEQIADEIVRSVEEALLPIEARLIALERRAHIPVNEDQSIFNLRCRLELMRSLVRDVLIAA